ncbi:SWIM zinc finger family protein [Cohnella xylanilytica]|uniref:SWIM zinc finger family protein n=1 Tax=Cohnella xylanilytica TaxID=557555 RepID=A0A841U261_9BACL|nr:SWIM zinc finger family protein [Cohnella xylanilytica]MBB6694626.1 SWIM zinc finger family protein [Cohnella xylanilytica]
MTIPTDHRLDDAQWNKLLRDAADAFDDLSIKRGFQWYKKGLVGPLDVAAPRRVEAVVEDAGPCTVRLNLDDMRASECECSSESPCKHMAAVLMAYADERGRSIHALANARTTFLMQQAEEAGVRASSAKTGGGSSPLPEIRRRALAIPAMSVAEWHEWFALCADRLDNATLNPRYVTDFLSVVRDATPSLSPAAERLFGLNAYLFVLRKLTAGTFMGYYTSIAAADAKDAILHGLEQELDLASEPEGRARLLETASYLRGAMLTETQGESSLLETYVELWARWIWPNVQDPGIYAEELRMLREEESARGASLSRLALLVARSWMHLYRKEDREAWSLLAEADKHRLRHGDVLRLLQHLAEAGEWPRLADWLAECAAPLIGRRYGSQDKYGQYWEAVVERLPEAEERMWDAIAGQLPYSGHLYEEKLRARGRWEQWIDYQLSLGSDPLDYRATELQPLEKEAPETLLPFYHQAVERYVLTKNRQGYKLAVKLLKRLAKLYKKLKREQRWESFLEAFASRHGRLRALQEELRKGKLIP